MYESIPPSNHILLLPALIVLPKVFPGGLFPLPPPPPRNVACLMVEKRPEVSEKETPTPQYIDL